MKSRTFTCIQAALVAIALTVGTIGINSIANAFTLIELLVVYRQYDFASASVNPDTQTPQVNVTNTGDKPVKVQILLYEYDATGAPAARTSRIFLLSPGYVLRETFPLTSDPRSPNLLKHVRPVVMAATETGEPAHDIAASFELVADDPTAQIGLLLPAIQKIKAAARQ